VTPPVFEYTAVNSIDEAVAELGQHGDRAKLLAGGQSLVPLLNMRLATPESAILSTLTFEGVVQQHGCKVLVSNNTGSDLSNVDFELTFGTHPAAALLQNPDFENADPGAYFNCHTAPPSGSTFQPNMVLDVVTNFSGFPSGTVKTGTDYPYDYPFADHDRCFDYNNQPSAQWRIAIAAGATATRRVEFRSGDLKKWSIGIGILPQGQEILIRRA